jgi:signal transduction histidine kinase
LVFTVTAARDADAERRSQLLLAVTAIVGLLMIVTALTSRPVSGNLYTWTIAVPVGIPTMLIVFALARRARVDAASQLLSSYALAAIALIAVAEGPDSNRLSLALIATVGSGAVLNARLLVVGGICFVGLLVGLVAARAAGLYAPFDVALGTEPLYLPFIRQSIAIGAIVPLLRRGYDRLAAQVRDRERARRAAVDAARAINLTLEAQVTERTAALAASHYRLSRLAAQLATDLGAGLDPVRQRLDEFMARESDLGPEVLRDVTKARAAADRLAVMTQRLHAHASVGTAALRPARVDMDALVRDVVDDYRRSSRDVEVDWQLAALPAAWADPTLVRTVVENLISNAIKYSKNQRPPIISVGYDPARGYFVRDNGVGFDPRNARDLFSPFHRLHAGHEFEGHGVGLANARRILERLGGEISADGQPGAGATFAFQLPPADGGHR